MTPVILARRRFLKQVTAALTALLGSEFAFLRNAAARSAQTDAAANKSRKNCSFVADLRARQGAGFSDQAGSVRCPLCGDLIDIEAIADA